MKIELSNNGHTKEWKPLKELAASFAQMEEGPFGKDYHILAFDGKSEISNLLIKFDKSSELEFYFHSNILYISIESEKFMYIVKMFKETLKEFTEQIKKDKKIVIATLGSNQIEKMFLYDIIM